MTVKTMEELMDLLGVLAQWAHARKMLDDVQAECADCSRVLREAEQRLFDVVINHATDSADEQQESEPDEDER